MLRIYLSGRMTIEAGDSMIGPQDFPGQQGRAAFAYLVWRRGNPISRQELADALWPGELPAAWASAISAHISKLRSLLSRAGLSGPAALEGAASCYTLRLPPDTWVDHEAAADAIHEAETALKAGDPARAYGPSAVAARIAKRPFLPGVDARWVDDCRDRLASILIRALECRAEVYLWNGEYSLAVEVAREAVTVSPFRETAYQLLMRANHAAGNAAEALRVYERCRTLIAEELGVDPSAQTKAVHAEVLRSL